MDKGLKKVTKGVSRGSSRVIKSTGKGARSIVKGVSGVASSALRGSERVVKGVSGVTSSALRGTQNVLRGVTGATTSAIRKTQNVSLRGVRGARGVVNTGLSAWGSNTFVVFVILLLVAYSSVGVHYLPVSYLRFFEHTLTKIVALLVVAFVGLYSPAVALFLAISLIVTLQVAQKKKILTDLGLNNVQATQRMNASLRQPQVQEESQDVNVLQGMMENFDTTDTNEPVGYNDDQSCVQGCQSTDASSYNLSGQCSNVKTFQDQFSAQGLDCPPGPSASIGAPVDLN